MLKTLDERRSGLDYLIRWEIRYLYNSATANSTMKQAIIFGYFVQFSSNFETQFAVI